MTAWAILPKNTNFSKEEKRKRKERNGGREGGKKVELKSF